MHCTCSWESLCIDVTLLVQVSPCLPGLGFITAKCYIQSKNLAKFFTSNGATVAGTCLFANSAGVCPCTSFFSPLIAALVSSTDCAAWICHLAVRIRANSLSCLPTPGQPPISAQLRYRNWLLWEHASHTGETTACMLCTNTCLCL